MRVTSGQEIQQRHHVRVIRSVSLPFTSAPHLALTRVVSSNINTDNLHLLPITAAHTSLNMEATSATTVPPSNETAIAAPVEPIAMSFPAILRGPGGPSDRFAHLRAEHLGSQPSTIPKRNRRDEKEGKRWIRRKENGMPSVYCALGLSTLTWLHLSVSRQVCW